MSDEIGNAILAVLIVVAIAVMVALSVSETKWNFEHPCQRYATETEHVPASDLGTVMWLTTGSVAYLPLNTSAHDRQVEKCVER